MGTTVSSFLDTLFHPIGVLASARGGLALDHPASAAAFLCIGCSKMRKN